MKVSVIQLSAGADKKDNVKRALALVQEAVRSKAKFILLPEMFAFRSKKSPDDLRAFVAETIGGETIQTFAEVAKKHQSYLLVGSLHEKRPPEPKLFNTSVLLGPDGARCAVYRKQHLFEAIIDGKRIREAKVFAKGRRWALVQVGGYTVGLAICYDVRFPLMFQQYKKGGAEILCLPSSFTRRTGQAHWESLLRARAIENRCYVLAPNQVGTDGSLVEAYGHSMIISPWGEILADAKTAKEKVLSVQLSKAVLKKVKKALPL